MNGAIRLGYRHELIRIRISLKQAERADSATPLFSGDYVCRILEKELSKTGVRKPRLYRFQLPVPLQEWLYGFLARVIAVSKKLPITFTSFFYHFFSLFLSLFSTFLSLCSITRQAYHYYHYEIGPICFSSDLIMPMKLPDPFPVYHFHPPSVITICCHVYHFTIVAFFQSNQSHL